MEGVITAIEAVKTSTRTVNIHLDSGQAFRITKEAVLQAGLRTGLTLTDDQVRDLLNRDALERTYVRALHFLSYRPRSESEVRCYLARRATPSEILHSIVERLKREGLIDDDAFARFWVENRSTFSPRGQRLLRQELRSKGLASSVIEENLPQDEEESAYAAAAKRARALAQADWETFCRKLFPFLQRRGFSYDVAKGAVARLWKESRPPA
ncbi:MAG: RecX family transcriptional regulator [Chloroflexota bacterium]